MKDFTVAIYKEFLKSLIEANYSFQTFDEFLKTPKERTIILRHDVDLRPQNSLEFAKIQHALGVRGTYYFRAVPESWDEAIIKEIANMDHEIGYHYECLTTVGGDLKKGIEDFEKNLSLLRALAPVSTICMHGSPMSKYDSKDLWKTYDYKEYQLIGEPYFDVNYNDVFYLTDTGRRWDGHKVSVRDKVNSNYDLSFATTDEIIKASKSNSMPDKIMFTFHPQRWNDAPLKWYQELIAQNIKNVVKKLIYVR